MIEQWKDEYLAYWHLTPGTPEAEEAWRQKVDMHMNPKRAPMGFVQGDVCYDSPIDGRPITNKHARREDMKRAGCIEYEPGMKQDAERSRQESESRLEKAVDQTLDREISQLPAAKKERLVNEVAAGLTPEPQRLTHGG